MRKKLLDFMQGRFGILWCMAVLLLAMSPVKAPSVWTGGGG